MGFNNQYQDLNPDNRQKNNESPLVCRCRVTAPELTRAFLAAQSHPSELSISAINAVTLNNLPTGAASTCSKRSKEDAKPIDTQQLEIETKILNNKQLESLTPVKAIEIFKKQEVKEIKEGKNLDEKPK